MTTNLLPERPTYIAIALALVFAMISAIAGAQSAIIVYSHIPDTCQPMDPVGPLVQLGRVRVKVPQYQLVAFDIHGQDTTWVQLPLGRYDSKLLKLQSQEYRSPNCPDLLYREAYTIAR